MKLKPISFNPIQSLMPYFVQYILMFSIVYWVMSIINPSFSILPTSKMVLGSLSIVLLFSIVMTIRPYLGAYKKIFTLYSDLNNNLYIDKCLVDKTAILKNYKESAGSGSRRIDYFIIVFSELPEEIKKKNYGSNAIVYCEIKTFANWFSFKNKTQKYLQNIAVKPAIIE